MVAAGLTRKSSPREPDAWNQSPFTKKKKMESKPKLQKKVKLPDVSWSLWRRLQKEKEPGYKKKRRPDLHLIDGCCCSMFTSQKIGVESCCGMIVATNNRKSVLDGHV